MSPKRQHSLQSRSDSTFFFLIYILRSPGTRAVPRRVDSVCALSLGWKVKISMDSSSSSIQQVESTYPSISDYHANQSYNIQEWSRISDLEAVLSKAHTELLIVVNLHSGAVDEVDALEFCRLWSFIQHRATSDQQSATRIGKWCHDFEVKIGKTKLDRYLHVANNVRIRKDSHFGRTLEKWGVLPTEVLPSHRYRYRPMSFSISRFFADLSELDKLEGVRERIRVQIERRCNAHQGKKDPRCVTFMRRDLEAVIAEYPQKRKARAEWSSSEEVPLKRLRAATSKDVATGKRRDMRKTAATAAAAEQTDSEASIMLPGRRRLQAHKRGPVDKRASQEWRIGMVAHRLTGIAILTRCSRSKAHTGASTVMGHIACAIHSVAWDCRSKQRH